MNDVERMQGQLAALTGRVRRLEVAFDGQRPLNEDWAEASRLAVDAGFPVEILVLPARRAERLKLAGALKARGWSMSRIARALNCTERTIERWFE